MSEPLQIEVSSDDLVRALLRETNNESPPTKINSIVNYLGLEIKEFDDSDRGRWELSSRVKAFLLPSKRLVGVYKALGVRQRNFSILHEVGHFVLPGHTTSSELMQPGGTIIDEGKTLSLSATDVQQQEVEANRFAADCLFQLDRFDRVAAVSVLDWRNIRTAADHYQASIEATARRWIERSDKPCALVVFNPENRLIPDSPLEIKYTITSEVFRRTYFYGLKPGQTMGPETLAYRLFHRLVYHDDPEETLLVEMPHQTLSFRMRLFDNSYRVFGLITPIVE